MLGAGDGDFFVSFFGSVKTLAAWSGLTCLAYTEACKLTLADVGRAAFLTSSGFLNASVFLGAMVFIGAGCLLLMGRVGS